MPGSDRSLEGFGEQDGIELDASDLERALAFE